MSSDLIRSGSWMGRQFLIVTADDFGLHVSINEAVEQACSAGILTAASLMVSAPAFVDAVERARRLSNLRVGLHLVLAEGRAVLEPDIIPALVDADGWFDARLVRRAIRLFAIPSVRRQVEMEIRAQFQRFADTGLPLDHVNMHKHLQLHPTLARMILRIGREFGVQAIRVPAEPLWFSGRAAEPLPASSASILLGPWVALLRRHIRAAGVVCNDHVFGIACSGRMDEGTLLDILQRLPAGVTEIYLHPATSSEHAASTPAGSYRHADELAALVSPRVAEVCNALRVPRGGYSDLIRSGA
jgi:hopanoid biosynthesis associated protein HpnK